MARPSARKELLKSEAVKQITPRKWDRFLRHLIAGDRVREALKQADITESAYRALLLVDDEKREQKDKAILECQRSIWTDEIMDDIFLSISRGKLVKDAVAELCPVQIDPEVAAPRFFNVLQNDPIYMDKYRFAREVQMWGMADDILEISDNTDNDLIEGPKGTMVSNPSAVRRAEAKVRTRQWLMEKLFSKQFGAKVQNEHTVQVLNHAEQLDEARRRKANQAEKHRAKLESGRVVSEQ